MLLPISVPNLLWAYWKLYSRIGEQNKSLSMQNLKWQLYVYRCISTYARTSNCQIHSRGLLLHSKTLYWYFTDAKYFLELFLWNYFSMHIKAEGMTQFDIFHVFAENSVNSELCFFWALLKLPLKAAKILNLSKNAHVWGA